MILSILNFKGGAGKSTLATNTARGLQLAGYTVRIVDSDPQGTALDWAEMQQEEDGFPVVTGATLPKALIRVVKDMKQLADAVVIDGAAKATDMNIAAIRVSQVVLIPVQPSAADIWAASDLIELIKDRQELMEGAPLAAFVVSRQITGSNLAGEVQEALESFGIPIFSSRTSQRVVFAEALAQGKTVLDLDPDSKASEEIRAIVNELIEWVS